MNREEGKEMILGGGNVLFVNVDRAGRRLEEDRSNGNEASLANDFREIMVGRVRYL